MEELASIYCEEKMFDEARKCLLAPFYPTINPKDVSSHYFTLAYFYQCIGKYDSAVIYNKEGMKHGSKEDNSIAALDLANIYKEIGDNLKAVEYYELHELYEDSINRERKVENEDFMKQIDENINSERENATLAEMHLFLIIVVFVIVVVFFLIIYSFIKWYKAKKRLYYKQHERARRQWEKIHTDDMENIAIREEEIKKLEVKLKSSTEVQLALRKKIEEAETVLAKQKEQLISEQGNIESLVTDLEHSVIYQQFHKLGFVPSNEDFKKLEDALNVPYDNFTIRLRKLYPMIQTDELQICCLVKIGLRSKEICNIMHFQANALSMKRLRLYKKIFNKKGSATEFDAFIREF